MKRKLTIAAFAIMLVFSIGFITTGCGTSSDTIKIGKAYEVSEESVYKISVKKSGVYNMSFTSLENGINCVTFYSDTELENTIGYYWVSPDASFELVLLKGKTYYIECEYNGLQNYSFIIEPTDIPLVKEIKTNVSYKVTNLGEPTIVKVFTFTPSKEGSYTFTITAASTDAECSINVSDYLNFTSGAGDGSGTDNFNFEADFEAGKIYYISAYCDTGADFSFIITKNV